MNFSRYFEAWEHQNRTRHEKIHPGSYSEIFWPDVKLIGTHGIQWAPISFPSGQKSENHTPGIFFHAAFDFDAPRPQNTHQK